MRVVVIAIVEKCPVFNHWIWPGFKEGERKPGIFHKDVVLLIPKGTRCCILMIVLYFSLFFL